MEEVEGNEDYEIGEATRRRWKTTLGIQIVHLIAFDISPEYGILSRSQSSCLSQILLSSDVHLVNALTPSVGENSSLNTASSQSYSSEATHSLSYPAFNVPQRIWTRQACANLHRTRITNLQPPWPIQHVQVLTI